MMVEGVALAHLLEEYDRQCATSNEIVAAHSLDDVGRHPDFGSAAASLRWMLIHMVEETARHAGHIDAIRELVDGAKGYYWRGQRGVRPTRRRPYRHGVGTDRARTVPTLHA